MRQRKPTGQGFSNLLKGLVIVSALMTLIALCFLPASYHRNNSIHWPTASGVVTNVDLKTYLRKPRRPDYFTPVVYYTYTVQGAPRTGTRIDFADFILVLQKGEALAWLDRNYPVGKQVTVYYDPKNPALAVLVPGATDLLLICWVSALTAALCCAASVVLLNRQKNKLPKTSPATAAPRSQHDARGIDRLFHILATALVALSLTGCCCIHDARGPSSICEVHHLPLKTAVVPDWGGCVLPTIPYAEAREKLFPNAYPNQLNSPWPWKRQRIYLCNPCIRAEEQWRTERPPVSQLPPRPTISPSNL